MSPNNDSLEQEALDLLSQRDHDLQAMSYRDYLQTPEGKQHHDKKPSQQEDTLSTMPYQEYLQTPHWKSLREEKLRQENHTCQVCNASGVTLNVHHRTYERRGRENLSDLIVLCQDCHELFHTHGKLAQYGSGAKPAPDNKPSSLDFDLYPEKLRQYSFSTFKTIRASVEPSQSALKVAFCEASNAAQTLEKSLKNGDKINATLIFAGGPGTGKTHLLAAICNYLGANGIECSMISTVSFFLWLQSCQIRSLDYYPLLQKLREVPFLALDDIGRGKYSEFREEIYYHIIDGRVERGLPTAVSTSDFRSLFDVIGKASTSRLMIGLTPIKMTGEDYRLSP